MKHLMYFWVLWKILYLLRIATDKFAVIIVTTISATTNTNITAPNSIMVTMIDIKVSKDKYISRWVNRVLFNKAG